MASFSHTLSLAPRFTLRRQLGARCLRIFFFACLVFACCCLSRWFPCFLMDVHKTCARRMLARQKTTFAVDNRGKGCLDPGWQRKKRRRCGREGPWERLLHRAHAVPACTHTPTHTQISKLTLRTQFFFVTTAIDHLGVRKRKKKSGVGKVGPKQPKAPQADDKEKVTTVAPSPPLARLF